MMSQALQLTVAAWMITYLVHSTVLLAAVWTIAGLLRHRAEPIVEMLWRFALIAPIVTVSLQLGLSVRPLMGALAVPDRIAAHDAAPPSAGANGSAPGALEPDRARLTPRAAQSINTPATRHPVVDGIIEHRVAQVAEQEAAETPGSATGLRGGRRVTAGSEESSPRPGAIISALRSSDYLMGVTVIIAVALLAAAARSTAGHLRLRALMRGRRPITDGPAVEMLDRLQRRSSMRRRVRLTCSDRLAAPIAFGVVRPEICLPSRILDRFDPAEQESVLAHELAHHVRGDPVWQWTMHALAGLLFFQPLNALACRRLRELAELGCDTWAAEQTGDRVTLAHCLAEVAGWIAQRPAGSALQRAMGMAGHPSALRRRITRLLDEASNPRSRGVRRWSFALSPLLLVVTVWAVPGVSAPTDHAIRQASNDGKARNPEARETNEPTASSGEGAAALLDDLQRLDAETAALRETADRLPLDQAWIDSIDDLTNRAQHLRARGERFVDALGSASDEGVQEETGVMDENDELDY
ncbi:MAG: M56 family metallopeptidase [Planctomycetota bacterium]|nr:M56 family metallopeptidase [Planctomycetota bacterium]